MTTRASYAVSAGEGSQGSALGQLIGRILLSALFLIAGFGKLAAPAGTMAYIASAGLPVPTLSYAAALIIEIGGGVLLVLGYRTRLVAAVLGVFSIVTALVFHGAWGDAAQLTNFLKNLGIAGGMLMVALNGAGGYSIDARRSSSR